MDDDEKYCGTCKHGILHDSCSDCEKEYEMAMQQSLSADAKRHQAAIKWAIETGAKP